MFMKLAGRRLHNKRPLTELRHGGKKKPKKTKSSPHAKHMEASKVLDTYLLKHWFFDCGLSWLQGLRDNSPLRN